MKQFIRFLGYALVIGGFVFLHFVEVWNATETRRHVAAKQPWLYDHSDEATFTRDEVEAGLDQLATGLEKMRLSTVPFECSMLVGILLLSWRPKAK